MPSSVFERLYQQSTAASRGQQHQSGSASSRSASRRTETPTKISQQQAHRTPQQSSSKDQLQPLIKESENSPVTASPPVSQPQILVPLTWKLSYTSKYDASESMRPLSLSILLDPDIAADPSNPSYQRIIARQIIEQLFHRDHSAGKRWDYDPATVEPLLVAEETSEGGSIHEYQASKEATWDWKDIYAVATAQGRICFDNERQEICIRQYSYYCAG